MSPKWCCIAPVINYWDKVKQFDEPAQFANGVIFGPMQDWAKCKEALDWLRGSERDRVLKSTFSFSVEYQAESLGHPDPEWEGPKPRSMQDKAEELVMLANLAIWLACPSSVSFDVILHFNRPGDGTSIRRVIPFGMFLPHILDADSKPTTADFRLAATLHKVLSSLRRDDGTVWTAARVLWKVLHEPMWEVRFLLSWVAMEALYGPISPQEISYRLSQRVAFFLGSNKSSEARKIFEIAKNGYGWRSKVVHGSRLSKLTTEVSKTISYEAETLLRKTFLRILEDPEMISKFDGADREEHLDSLIFDAYQAGT